MTPQENLFNFLKERGLTRFLSYEDYQKGTPRNVELKPYIKAEESEKQLEKIGINLKKIGEIQKTKAEKRKDSYNAWKDEMPPEEREAFEYALEEGEGQ